MSDVAKIPCKIVGGYGKETICSANDLKPDHAWNLWLLDGGWVPVDVTWAAGATDSVHGYQKRFDAFGWLCPPERFIHTHLPQCVTTQWTGLSNVPSYRDFCNGL